MTIVVLGRTLGTAEVVKTLLARAGVAAEARQMPPDPAAQARQIEALALAGRTPCVLDPAAAVEDGVAMTVEPSVAAWLTRDAAANRAVLGVDEVPAPERATAWLGAHRCADGRGFAMSIDGIALARTIDLGTLAAFAPSFRDALVRFNPLWASTQPVRRGRGRPPGVAMFRGTGYALCLELLHRGAGATVTPAELGAALDRTKTPMLRFIAEGQRRGYLRRTSPRGPLVVRNTERILDDVVTDVRARERQRPAPRIGLRTDRDRDAMITRLATRLALRGRVFAVTGGAVDFGGPLLVGGAVTAYTSLEGLDPLLGDAYRDDRWPHLVLVEPYEDAVVARLTATATPYVSAVSRWQATIDLLASNDEREREAGAEARQRLLREAHS
jgi:hypothetical protein